MRGKFEFDQSYNQTKKNMQVYAPSNIRKPTMWRGVWSHPFNLGTPSNSGLQGPLFRPLNITYDPLKQP